MVDLLHSLTQAGYIVSFHSDFNGMIGIHYTEEGNPKFYEHEHIGYPNQPRERLEEGIIRSLSDFKERYL